MADRTYGIQQSQPHDVYGYVKANASRVGLDAETYMLSEYQGTITPGSTQIIFSDTPNFVDESLMDGRTKRYSIVTAYVVTVAPRAFTGTTDIVEKELATLGYIKTETISAYANGAAFSTETGVDPALVVDLTGASKITMLAGPPRYLNAALTIGDVPNNGVDCVRVNGRWQPIDLSSYETISGSQDKIDAALGSSFNSRNVLLTSNTAIFADGEPAVFDPVGGAGWYYKNTTGNKINWYFYQGGSDTETLGALKAADGGYYMVVDTRNTTSWPMLTIYTARQNDGNDHSWYRSRVVYGPAGQYSNKLSLGLHVCHTPNLSQSVKDSLAIKFPGATFTELDTDVSVTVGPQGNLETLSLLAVSTSSGEPEEQEAFVLRENALFFGGSPRSWQFQAIPTQQPEYTNYYKGAYADSANYPETGELSQWIINSTDDTMLVWDVEGGEWKATGSTAQAPGSTVQDYPFQYVYSSFDGSGYGYANAYPASNWQNTPDGKLQATGYTSDILSRRIKFATLVNPGDEVTVQVGDNAGAFNRYTFIGLTKGTDANSLSWKVAGQPSSGNSWMLTDPADRALVELYSAYIEPYFGGTSYGYNLTGRSNSSNLAGMSGNQGEKQITFRVGDDYAIEMYVDGNYFVKTLNIPQSGVDLYYTIYGNTGRVFDQPTGNGANFISGTAPNATGARYFMSTVATPGTATELASGNGYYLYSDLTPGDPSDVELDDQEANAARFCRVFQDYTGLDLQQRAELTLPIVAEDEKGLSHVEFLARGYFHSLDLNIQEIGAKMELYAPALQAAVAGSVEVCLAQLQSLMLPVSGGGEVLAFDPYYSGYQSGGTSDTRASVPTSSQTFADYGITGMRFWGQGTSLGQMEFYFDSYGSPNASLDWRSQERTLTFNVPGSTEAFEGTFTMSPSDLAYASGSQVTYSNPGTWGHVEVEALAQFCTSNGLDGSLITFSLGAPQAQSPAVALSEVDVVNELIAYLQLHLQKFPR